jgi:DNA-binding NarL/FixJ family response regulator
MISILLADDDTLVRTGLRAVLAGEPDLEVTGEAGDGAEAVAQARALRPDVVLMDVRMPGVDGIRATELIARSLPGVRVLVVTTFENDGYVYDALRAGASGFLLKRARPAEIVRAVRIVADGEMLLFPSSLRELAAQWGGTGPERADERTARLSAREADVLREMAAGRSNAEIAESLVLGVQTVKTHVGSVLAKLGARDRTQAVIIAFESGFVDPRG